MAGSHDSRTLRAALQTVIRRLGVLADDQTPCGKDLPVSEAHALHLLREHGPLAQTALQTLLGIDKSNVSRLRARLEAAGRVEAVASHSEGRPITVLQMTPAGHKLAQQLDEASGERFALLLEHIPEKGRKQVFAALGALNAALLRLDPGLETVVMKIKEMPSRIDDDRRLLSKRELQVLQLVAEGMTSAEIGRRLAIGKRTVETHRAKLGRKLKLKRQADLVRFAVDKGIVSARPRPGSRK